MSRSVFLRISHVPKLGRVRLNRPKYLGTAYMRAYSARNSNKILHGENF